MYDDSFPEFVGPISVRSVKGKGRGIFATQDLAPGELIMGSRALAIVFPDSNPASSSRLLREIKKLGSLRESVADLIRKDSTFAAQVYDLYAGPGLGYLETPAENLIDMDRIERICSFNAFQGSVLGYASENCFGLWYLPSFLNHDCLGGNARWTVFKNFMFVRVIKKIRKDEEVLISYVDPNESYSFRRNFFLKHEFKCSCALCEQERTEGQSVRRRRDIVMEDFRDLPDGDVDGLESVIEELESLRPHHAHLNIFLIQPLIHLGFSLYEKRLYGDAAGVFIRAFQLCSVCSQLSLLCVSVAFTIATCFVRSAQSVEAKDWVKTSKTCVFNQYGTMDVIEIIRPAFFNEMKENGLL